MLAAIAVVRMKEMAYNNTGRFTLVALGLADMKHALYFPLYYFYLLLQEKFKRKLALNLIDWHICFDSNTYAKPSDLA